MKRQRWVFVVSAGFGNGQIICVTNSRSRAVFVRDQYALRHLHDDPRPWVRMQQFKDGEDRSHYAQRRQA